MLDIGSGELLVIVLVVLLLFGPKKIPEIAKSMSNGMYKLKKARAQLSAQIANLQNEIKESVEQEEKIINEGISPIINEVKNLPRDQSFIEK